MKRLQTLVKINRKRNATQDQEKLLIVFRAHSAVEKGLPKKHGTKTIK